MNLAAEDLSYFAFESSMGDDFESMYRTVSPRITKVQGKGCRSGEGLGLVRSYFAHPRRKVNFFFPPGICTLSPFLLWGETASIQALPELDWHRERHYDLQQG